MKRQSYDKGWGNIFIAIFMMLFGIRFEPLLAVFGGLILTASAIASVAESRARKYDEEEYRKVYPEHAEQHVAVG